MKCYECKYEHADCKGNKQDDCQNFVKKCAINYPEKIRELERKIKAIDENVKLKAELKQADEAYDIQGKQLLEALDEIERLKAENEKLKAELEKSVECGADCNACIERCRAWQNGYNNRPTTEIIGTKALIESYIDRLQNCGLGKKKSLEYVGKFVSCLIVENGVIPNE